MNSLIQIRGIKEIQAKMKNISNDKQKKAALIGILKKVANPTVQLARQNSPVSKKPHVISGKRAKRIINPGNLKKSITAFAGKKGKAKENPTVYVGARYGGKNDGFYMRFVELGHNIYRKGFKRNRKLGANNSLGTTRRIKGLFFMKKTFEQSKGVVSEKTEKAVENYVNKIFKKI